MIRNPVGFLASGWEVFGQELAAGFDGGDQSSLECAAPEVVSKLAHDLLPGFL